MKRQGIDVEDDQHVFHIIPASKGKLNGPLYLFHCMIQSIQSMTPTRGMQSTSVTFTMVIVHSLQHVSNFASYFEVAASKG